MGGRRARPKVGEEVSWVLSPLRGRTLLDSSVLREHDSFGRANARPIKSFIVLSFRTLCE